jgi:hypothetical protein
MSEPKIYMPEVGVHNKDLDSSVDRLEKSKSYRDLSTIIICPTRGQIPARVVQSWMGLMRPMNQKVIGPLFISGMEVGQAYNAAIEMILANPDLRNWKYILTIEEDNIPPADGLLKLYESMDKYDVVQGLYWTKGEGGQPMIYGDPAVMPKNFIPQIPQADKVQHCNGLGMGFNLFKLDMFKDPDIPKPWFKTVQEVIPGQGAKAYTQDLYFYENAAKAGYVFACDNRVRVGHYDYNSDIVW